MYEPLGLKDGDKVNASHVEHIEDELTLLDDGLDSVKDSLSNLNIGGSQILRATNSCTSLGTSSSWTSGTWRSASGGTGSRESIEVTDAPNPDIAVGWEIVNESSGNSDIGQNSVPVVVGQTYTLSCYARTLDSGVLRVQFGNSSYVQPTYVLTSEWERYSATSEMLSKYAKNDITNIFLGCEGVGSIQICGMKFEVGDHATDWCESPWDNEQKLPVIQYGSFVISQGAIEANATTTVYTVTFDTPFSSVPKIFLTYSDISSLNYGNTALSVENSSATGFSVKVHNNSSSSALAPKINWFAVG